MFSTTVLNIHFMENVNTVVSTQLGKSLSSGDTARVCRPIVYLLRAKGGKEKSFRLSATCVSHYGREAFLVDGGFMEEPNFAHMPEHSWRLDGGRTTAIFKPIIIGFEWPLPLIPDRITLDRNVICVRTFVSWADSHTCEFKMPKSHNEIWKKTKI